MNGETSVRWHKIIKFIGTSEQENEIFDGQNNAIEERGDVVFKNGAVYKGQWLGQMKHGFGV